MSEDYGKRSTCWGWLRMWVLCCGETETLRRETVGHWSGWGSVGKSHLGEMQSRLRCDQWFHLQLSVSGRAFSSGILVKKNSHEKIAVYLMVCLFVFFFKFLMLFVCIVGLHPFRTIIQTFGIQAGSPVTTVKFPPPEVRPRPLQTGMASQFREEM